MNYELDTHEEIVEAVAPSFPMRQKRTEDTPFMMSPLLNDIGYLAEFPAADEIVTGLPEEQILICMRIHRGFSNTSVNSCQGSGELY